MRELKPELDGYRDFCRYRDNEEALRAKTNVCRTDWLAAKRRQIFLRIKRRQEERARRACLCSDRSDPTPSGRLADFGGAMEVVALVTG